MSLLVTAFLCYLGLGALVCAGPRGLSPDEGEFTPLGQWRSFRASFGAVLTWPYALWREFAPY